jgi:SAM-dependent methyltransferase
MKDIFGKALLDFFQGQFQPPLFLHNEYGDPEEMPVESYFYGFEDYSELEIFALQQAYGKILDVGAASGRHALHLQENHQDITALDISALCGQLMRQQGVKQVLIQDVMGYEGVEYDSILMLMNGIGIAGDLDGLEKLLIHLKKIVKPAGQLLVDSTDISYLYEGAVRPEEKYFGQLVFHYEYRGEEDEPFRWLYIDQQKLMDISNKCGWNCQVIFEDETDAYLARLTKN